MNESKEKFIKRNQKYVDELVELIKSNEGNIRCLLLSSEMSALSEYIGEDDIKIDYDFKSCQGFGSVGDIRFPVLVNAYQPASAAQLVLRKENQVDFDVPCVCGIYSDEPHTLK